MAAAIWACIQEAWSMQHEKAPTAGEWSGSRGDSWRAHLDGMEAMLGPVDGPLLDALRLDAPYRIADVACGGGGTTFELLRRAPVGSVVHGFDISPSLVEAARARAPDEARALSFHVADVATAPPPDAPYQRLASRFGVMFFDDAPAAFRNLARWLSPGGRFAFAVWGRAADNPWLSTVRDVVAALVEVPPPEPDTPGAFRYAEPELLVELLRRAGFVEVEAHAWRGALAVGGGKDAASAADFALSAFSIAQFLSHGGDDARKAAQRMLAERYARHERGGVVRLDALAHLVTGGRVG